MPKRYEARAVRNRPADCIRFFSISLQPRIQNLLSLAYREQLGAHTVLVGVRGERKKE